MKGSSQTPATLDFFRSALTVDGALHSYDHIIHWLAQKNQEVMARVEVIPLDRLKQWHADPRTGNIHHHSGRFFSIEGIHIQTNAGQVPEWEQPIINQPEIGILGILTQKKNGILHFLMQAKTEPGNVNIMQLSPTLQATRSNYTRVHDGNTPLYLEYFRGERKAVILLDQLQSEQGARFLRKRNRNIIIEVRENEKVQTLNDFIWLTLGQIKQLIASDNLVNMDTRTVIAGIPFGSYDSDTLNFFAALRNSPISGTFNTHLLHSMLNHEVHHADLTRIISWITGLKAHYELHVRPVSLKEVKGWRYEGGAYVHHQKKYFSVIGVEVAIGNREVINWDQPMIKPAQEGLISFIAKKIDGVYHFLVQAKVETGNFDILELAPTVQCLTGNYREGVNEYSVPFINEVLKAKPEQIWYSAMQSEEGGRFFREQNRNMIIEAGPEFPDEVPENYFWMTLHQLMTFIQYNNYLNIAARSLIAAIRF